ncbi:hypothetical protein [Burkholderia territorii]|uniref:hypothetical protein n=1 Tax=Burkholderia territorii TaxID=1503055 RepID=UPI0012D88239|nr:hypothetical protein [Burkholderia territorii]
MRATDITTSRAAPRCGRLAGAMRIRAKVPKPAHREIDGVRRADDFAGVVLSRQQAGNGRHRRRASLQAGCTVVGRTVARRLQMSRRARRDCVGDDDPLPSTTADDTRRAGVRPVHWMETSA